MAMKKEPLVLPALRGRFGDWVYYSCLMPLGELGRRVDYAQDIHPTSAMSDFIQRSLEGKRASHIAQYLTNRQDRFFNSLVLAVYGGSPGWLDVGGFKTSDPNLRGLLSQEAEDSLGFLHLTGKELIFALDGQHRLAGIKKAISTGGAALDEQVSVILVSHKKTKPGLQRTRRLFTTLNKTAVAVRKKDIIALDEDDVMAITVRRLVEEDPRFASPRIALVASQNMPSNNLVSLTTVSGLYDILKLVFANDSGRQSGRGLRFNRPSDERLDHYYALAQTYFSAIAEISKPIKDVLTVADPHAVTVKQRRKDGGHLLFRPVGLDLFTRTVIRYAKHHNVSLIDATQALKGMPMNLAAAPYLGVLWDPAKQVMKPGGKAVAGEVMAYIAGLPVTMTDLVGAYRVAQGHRRTDATIALPAVI
jgi:DNA sulfur modification protein DndB